MIDFDTPFSIPISFLSRLFRPKDSSSISADLCLSLSGRTWMWPLTREFLELQEYPHDQMRLIVLDTSQQAEYAAMIRDWLKGCDYGKTVYLRDAVGPVGLADLPRTTRVQEVCRACVRIYNHFVRASKAPVVFFLEDDVVPPLDAYPRLLRLLTPEISSVSGLYWHRHEHNPICWNWVGDDAVFPPIQEGVRQIGGNGFGCLVIHGDLLRRTHFRCGPTWQNYDYYFYRDLRDRCETALLDWDCVCRHYTDTLTWS